jgi:CRP-like cAMP-binding protein
MITFPPGNYILDKLPEAGLTIFPSARLVSLPRSEFTTHYDRPMANVDFPITALLSIVDVLPDGSTAEITTIGKEGFVEIDAALHHDVAMRSSRCLCPGEVVRVSLSDFQRALAGSKVFADSAYHSVRIRTFVTEQLAVCGLRHDANERLARWLLLICYKQQSATVEITHEAAAGMLGTRRATVSTAARFLQHHGAIDYTRGMVRITNHDALRSLSCSCFDVCRKALEQGV